MKDIHGSKKKTPKRPQCRQYSVHLIYVFYWEDNCKDPWGSIQWRFQLINGTITGRSTWRSLTISGCWKLCLDLCTYQCKAGGGGGRAWDGDLIVFVDPGVGRLTDLVLPGEGIFESFFARHRDIWLPTRTKKTETEHMFPAFTLHACAVQFEKIRKSWRPMRTSEGWVDFTVLSSNFVCFSVLVINWTS